MKQNNLIIFDFDGTIADSMWAWDELGSDTLSAHDIDVPADYRQIIRTMSVPKFSEYLSARYPQLGSAECLLSEWHKKMDYNYCRRIALKPGAKEFLTRVRDLGYTSCLASATHEFLLQKALTHFGIDNYFEFILTEDKAGVTKRDPAVYRTCMERAGANSAHTFVFEDAVHAVKTAHEMGLTVYAVEDASMRNFTDEISRYADAVIADFNDEILQKTFFTKQ